MSSNMGSGVLIIYTGGTLGSVRSDLHDPLSPLRPGNISEVLDMIPRYRSSTGELPINGVNLRLGTHSWDEPLDSSNVTSQDWLLMAQLIEQKYAEYEGFVILHGTDTLAYTASALAFRLAGLDKPVVITGSQLPIGEIRSDAVQNVVAAIEIAAARSLKAYVVPEVTVLFGNGLYRGCRATKLSTVDYNAFGSPNYPALASIGTNIDVNHASILPASSTTPITDRFDEGIALVSLFPGMSPRLLERILCSEGLRGVVLQTFGAGNAPSAAGFLAVIKQAAERGIVVVDVTQCSSGTVDLGAYAVSASLLDCGVVSGQDMTPEAALTKLSALLGAEESSDIVADRVQLNLRGEQRLSIFRQHFTASQVESNERITLTPLRPMVDGERYEPATLERAVLRITDLHLLGKEAGSIELELYIDLAHAGAQAGGDSSHFLGTIRKSWSAEEGAISGYLDVTEAARRLLDHKHMNQLVIVNAGDTPTELRRLEIAFYADC